MHENDSHIAAALQQLRTERTQAEAERDALDEFLARLEDRGDPVVTHSDATGTPVGSTLQDRRATTDLERVRTLYRETVMAVPHYDEYYGDSLEASIREEFGPEVASVLTGDTPLSQVARAKLVHEGQRARRQRERFLTVLDGEQEDLEDAQATRASIVADLEDLDSRPIARRSTEELHRWLDRLDALGDDCETLVAERQATFRRRSRRELPLLESEELATYLYRPLAVDHPVLADFVDLSERLETTSRHVEAELISRKPV